jgi:hypothetical protein
MRRHALRTLVKQGHEGAMTALGYLRDAPVTAQIRITDTQVVIGGALDFEVVLDAAQHAPVLVDYRISFARPRGKQAEKVFKLKTAEIAAGKPLHIAKKHKFKAGASTFTLHAGAHRITVQVNGRDVAQADFKLVNGA